MTVIKSFLQLILD